MAGGVLLKDFGWQEAEAREALRLIRELRLNQLGSVGTPRPVLEYWLSDGRAPEALHRELPTVILDSATLRVDQVQGRWFLRDDARIHFAFGPHAEEAARALAIIQRHGFNRVSLVGRAPPAMTVFLKDPNGAVPRPAATSAARTEPTRLGALPAALPIVPAGREPPKSDLPAAALGERVTFDWRQVQLRRDKEDWKLAAGSLVLASFGPNERDARQGLAALQHYHFTEQRQIGRPRPAFTYYLVNGEAPRGLMFGLGSVPFQPDALALRELDGNWTLADGNKPILQFGDRAEEAKQALQVIQKYRFDHLYRIGPGGTTGMTVLVRSR
jgi:hypothetical protein